MLKVGKNVVLNSHMLLVASKWIQPLVNHLVLPQMVRLRHSAFENQVRKYENMLIHTKKDHESL